MDKTQHPSPGAQPPELKLNYRVDVFENGAHLHVTTADGQFLGTVDYRVLNASCTGIVVNAFLEMIQKLAARVQPVIGAEASKINGHGPAGPAPLPPGKVNGSGG